MDLFRSRKRDADQMGQGEGSSLQKRKAGLSSSLDNLLDIGKLEDPDGTDSEMSATDSDEDIDRNDVNKASRKQKVFAMKSVKRDKKKEKDLRKKIEKNMITMDDFLGKQSEFKMWLFEEKSKNASEVSSPKLKTYFKQFVRLWNKRKLTGKYYRSSNLPDSPATVTSTNVNFLAEYPVTINIPLNTVVENVSEKSQTTSPFVTFGKTPPKVFRSKKFHLFSGAKDVALISVAPIGSPKVEVKNKENIKNEVHYLVPRGDKQACDGSKGQTTTHHGAIPYKVSTYPWASADQTSINTKDSSLDICSTSTPPNMSQTSGENWPSPPTQQEIRGMNCVTNSDSPHVPPPPPPRVESLQRKNSANRSPMLSSNYSDPSDKLPCNGIPEDPHYQDPIDCVSAVNSRTRPDHAKLVLKVIGSHNDEPDLSLYSKPVIEKRLSKEELEGMYAKPMKKSKRDPICEGKIEDATSGNLYEIIDKIKTKSVAKDVHSKGNIQPKADLAPKHFVEPLYQTMEECRANFKHDTVDGDVRCVKDDNLYKKKESPKKFASLSRFSNKRVMAASTEKIYETYLSYGRKSKIQRAKNEAKKSAELGSELQPIKQRCKSQPDMSISEKMNVFDINITNDDNVLSNQSSPTRLSSFKPKDINSTHSVNHGARLLRDRAKSYDDMDTPGTPIILSTPSFDSLCNVTMLKNDSVSMKSFSVRSGSSENVSICNISSSTNSSLSFGPDDRSEKSTSLQSLHSVHSSKSLSPVKEVEELPKKETTPEKVENVCESGCPSDNESYKSGFIPITPGKLNAKKHGIDFSNYLLKPVQIKESQQPSDIDSGTKIGSSSKGVLPESSEASHKINRKGQIKVVIKDTLSGVRTNMDNSKTGSVSRRTEPENRHAVQTVQDCQSMSDENKKPNVPNIGVAGRSRKKETQSTATKLRTLSTDRRQESQSKRHRGEKVKVDCKFLETDLDTVVSERPKSLMKKSKSHSGFEAGSDTVVTEIW
ncbi:uncharacterized protein LOC127850212 [Dreissena polymorpha]|uniref:Uncharacterized protein n=1 Tax=Dreissena polymorpha TaxID=45954 RepID=A0A9D4I130_DREPO|nr:uncharacterized protein LOC127850212 [Dreissena polymorpha]KAH3738476.1 hypothetical protein DPMN_045110 [Dreissena polymorpha]